jgi:hypothetical protein
LLLAIPRSSSLSSAPWKREAGEKSGGESGEGVRVDLLGIHRSSASASAAPWKRESAGNDAVSMSGLLLLREVSRMEEGREGGGAAAVTSRRRRKEEDLVGKSVLGLSDRDGWVGTRAFLKQGRNVATAHSYKQLVNI